MQAVDYVGKTFGRLTVLVEVLPRTRPRKWECKCSCGNTKEIQQIGLQNGNTRSCGCLKKERTSECKSTHGSSTTKLYGRWLTMRSRCYNRNTASYPYYGGRGVGVCDAWKDFATFESWAESTGYTSKLTLDRIDPDGNYEPGNCRWVTRVTQARNRRIKSTNTSGVTGVCFSEQYNAYLSYVGIDGIQVKLGFFPTIEEAAEVRKQYIIVNNLTDFY